MSTDGRPRSVRLLLACVLLLGLAGCSDDEPTRELDIAEAGSSSPTASGEAAPGEPESSAPAGVPDPRPAPTQGEKVEDDYGVWALQLPQKQPARLIGETLIDYMEVRNRAFHTGNAPLPALAEVSVGQPLTDIQGYVLDLEQRGLHTVGDSWYSVADKDVKVRGGRATLDGVCLLNATVDVNEQNIAQESPPDAYRLQVTAMRAAPDVWLITRVGFEDGAGC